MKNLDLEMQLDKAGLGGTVASVIIAWLYQAANAAIDNPWGYCAVLTIAASLTFWLFH